MTDRPELTIAEAAEAAGVTAKTIRRRLKADEFPDARRDGDGPTAPWVIPVDNLLAAGLKLNAPAGPDPKPQHDDQEADEPEPEVDVVTADPPSTSIPIELAEVLEHRDTELAEWRRRAEVAEAVAAERAAALADLRTALDLAQRQLTAGPPPPAAEEPAAPPAPPPTSAPRPRPGRWRAAWQALRGGA